MKNFQDSKNFERLKLEHPPTENCRATIVIPARNEAENIRETLAAFLRQNNSAGKPLDPQTFEIIILANNCQDATAQIVNQFSRENPNIFLHLQEIELAEEQANIGFVRRLLFNEAFARQADKNGIILTTDGDTAVAKDWIAANFAEIEKGADAVGGRILLKPGELERMDEGTRKFHLADEEYRLKIAALEAVTDFCPFDPAPRHHQHFNGSFAVTAAKFRQAGGLPEVKFLEDFAFFDALQKIDAKIRHSPFVRVYTSARQTGRAAVGLAYQLNEWQRMAATGEKFLVESPLSAFQRFTLRNRVRNLQNKPIEKEEITLVADNLGVKFDFLQEILKSEKTFGEIYAEILREQFAEKVWENKHPAVTLEEASQEFGKLNIDFDKLLPPR